MICRNQWLTMGGGRMFANSGFSIDTGSCSLYGATISLGIGRPFSLLCSCALHWYYRKCARQVLYCDKHQPSHRLIRSKLIKMSQFWDLLHLVLVANQHHRTYAIERIQWFFSWQVLAISWQFWQFLKKRLNTNNCHCQKKCDRLSFRFVPWLNLFKKYAWESNVDKYELHNDFFVAPATRGWKRSQAGLLSQIALGQMSPLLDCAIVNNCAQTEKESDKASPALPPELCIKTSFAGTGAKSSPAFNPSSVSPSSRDANTRMICTAVEGGLHHNALVGQMICRSGVD